MPPSIRHIRHIRQKTVSASWWHFSFWRTFVAVSLTKTAKLLGLLWLWMQTEHCIDESGLSEHIELVVWVSNKREFSWCLPSEKVKTAENEKIKVICGMLSDMQTKSLRNNKSVPNRPNKADDNENKGCILLNDVVRKVGKNRWRSCLEWFWTDQTLGHYSKLKSKKWKIDMDRLWHMKFSSKVIYFRVSVRKRSCGFIGRHLRKNFHCSRSLFQRESWLVLSPFQTLNSILWLLNKKR
jgi:hypothetical protein